MRTGHPVFSFMACVGGEYVEICVQDEGVTAIEECMDLTFRREIWVTTPAGLRRYEGRTIEMVQYEPEPPAEPTS